MKQQLRDTEPGTIVTIPSWKDGIRYVVQPYNMLSTLSTHIDIVSVDGTKTYNVPGQIQVEEVKEEK